jgi:hypothetical protein
MIARLFIVLALCGALGIAASWNTSSNGFASKTSSDASQPDHVIMTVAIEPDRAPPAPTPVSQAGRSSRERLIAQN